MSNNSENRRTFSRNLATTFLKQKYAQQKQSDNNELTFPDTNSISCTEQSNFLNNSFSVIEMTDLHQHKFHTRN